MITAAEQAFLKTHVYVPEQWPGYVTAITRTEPFLMDDFVVYKGQEQLTFIGYPLAEPFDVDRLAQAVEAAVVRFNPRLVSIAAPALPAGLVEGSPPPADCYYRLDLSRPAQSQKLRNMQRRAGREVTVSRRQGLGRDHKKLIDEFLRTRAVDEGTHFIFKRIPDYTQSGSAWVFEARNKKGELVAFDVAEFGARRYAFYMFNFRSGRRYIPGASDLLLAGVIEQARQEGKQYINLGLGINAGVSFFKIKWGGRPFLPHTAGFHTPARPADTWESLLDQLL